MVKGSHLSKLRILLVQHEFVNWEQASSWSYSWHLGIEEGLRANNVEFSTITFPWFSCARDICKGKKFDQVWINDIFHLGETGHIGEDDVAWLASLAPVRIGFCIESLEYSPEEYAAFPYFAERVSKIKLFLKHITHGVFSDEVDAANSAARNGIPSIWGVLAAVPERYIYKRILPPTRKVALFSGKLYGQRGSWLENPQLKNLFVYQESPEKRIAYPFLFNKFHSQRVHGFVERHRWLLPIAYAIYLHSVRHIRRYCFKLWLKSMLPGVAVVNLPSNCKLYGGRVFEGMAAGRPVIAWDVPHRPRNKALFKEGEEILLYRSDSPGQLLEHIQHILSDPVFGRRIAENAQRKIRTFHTSEKRVKQILNWIETGEIPRYD
jgi:hypothetical protein